MEWTLPGTVLSVDADRPQAAEEVFSSLFLAGGLVLSQVKIGRASCRERV